MGLLYVRIMFISYLYNPKMCFFLYYFTWLLKCSILLYIIYKLSHTISPLRVLQCAGSPLSYLHTDNHVLYSCRDTAGVPFILDIRFNVVPVCGWSGRNKRKTSHYCAIFCRNLLFSNRSFNNISVSIMVTSTVWFMSRQTFFFSDTARLMLTGT